jgi:hypothetical protein
MRIRSQCLASDTMGLVADVLEWGILNLLLRWHERLRRTTRFLARRNAPAGAGPGLAVLSVDALESASYGCGMDVQEHLTFSRVRPSGSCQATLIGGKKVGVMAAVRLGTTRSPWGCLRRCSPSQLPFWSGSRTLSAFCGRARPPKAAPQGTRVLRMRHGRTRGHSLASACYLRLRARFLFKPGACTCLAYPLGKAERDKVKRQSKKTKYGEKLLYFVYILRLHTLSRPGRIARYTHTGALPQTRLRMPLWGGPKNAITLSKAGQA